MNKHRQAHLWPSELVTIGVLFALKGGYFSAFYRWLERDYAVLFGGVPERTRMLRLLAVHAHWCERFLADTGFQRTDGIPANLKRSFIAPPIISAPVSPVSLPCSGNNA